MWIGLGFLAIVFLCVMLCALGAFVTMAVRPGPTYVQPLPEGGEAGGAPVVQYGPLGYGYHGGAGLLGIAGYGIGLLFKLLFFGLLLLLGLGLIKRLFWGRPHYWGRHRYEPYPGKPPTADTRWKSRGRHPHWGPWAWHHPWEPWAPDEEAGVPPEEAMDEDEAEYTGPQE
jgi:hypothetical protein